MSHTDAREDAMTLRMLILSVPVLQNLLLHKVLEGLKISPVTLNLSLKHGLTGKTFTFSRSFKVPLLIMQLSAGQLELFNVSFLICDSEHSGDDLLLGLPLLTHLGIDSRIML